MNLGIWVFKLMLWAPFLFGKKEMGVEEWICILGFKSAQIPFLGHKALYYQLTSPEYNLN